MGSVALNLLKPTSTHGRLNFSHLPPQAPLHHKLAYTFSLSSMKVNRHLKFRRTEARATLDENELSVITSTSPTPSVNTEVEQSVKVLKKAAKTRLVAADEILAAFTVLEKAKLDPSNFLETLGGSQSPGRTWMLVFTAEKKLNGGRYFPITAVQRFDAAGGRIENGVYLGPIGCLTFEGPFSWKTRILAFTFERLRIKVGPLNPFDIIVGKKEDKTPSTEGPFFIWFYIDEEIAVARGRSGGTAFWCRCKRVSS